MSEIPRSLLIMIQKTPHYYGRYVMQKKQKKKKEKKARQT